MDKQTPTGTPSEESPTTRPSMGGELIRAETLASSLFAVCLVVFAGIIAGVFVWTAMDSRVSDEPARTGPQMGDHWHASYTVYIGDQRQPNMPTWESGVHTHEDGIIHIHPFQQFEERSGASLTKYFEYGGGVLSNEEIRIPGSSRTYFDGDQIPGENSEGHIYIAAVAAPESERKEELGGGWALVAPTYIPLDGDRILIFFSTDDQMRSIVVFGGGPDIAPTLTPPATAAPSQ